ncbi:MAG: DUF760 domain-containing protein [Cyanobacteria bacterium P01_D01_bin.73]
MPFNPNDADFLSMDSDGDRINYLLKYLKQQPPDVLAQVAKSATSEAKQIVSQNVQGLIGALPPDKFQAQIMTNHESLANLLASAMMTGYFLHQMEQRMEMENAILGKLSWDDDDDSKG